MKVIKFVITSEFDSFQYNIHTRDYLAVWSANSTYDDPIGVFWTSWENFSDIQYALSPSRTGEDTSRWGTIMLFDSAEDARKAAEKFGVSNYTVREILWEMER